MIDCSWHVQMNALSGRFVHRPGAQSFRCRCLVTLSPSAKLVWSVRSSRRKQLMRQPQALLDFFKGFGSSSATQERLDPQHLEPAFVSWLAAQGIPEQPLLMKDCGVEGRGLVAARTIRQGERLLQLPESLLITPETALQQSALAPLLAKQPLPEWSLLGVYLAELRHKQHSGDGTFALAPYIEILPGRPGTVLEWAPQEVRQLLQGSPLYRKARHIVRAAQDSWQELQPLVAQAETDRLIPRGAINQASASWAFGILLSRLIRLASKGNAQVLLPWGDLLNHDPSASCFLDWDEQLQAVVLPTDRAYRAGEQIYVSYGAKSSGELLLSYGFAPPPATNPAESYSLQVELQSKDPLRDLKVEALKRHGLSASMEFPLKMAGIPGGLLEYLAFCSAQPRVAQETFELADCLFERCVFPVLDGQDLEHLALRELMVLCVKAQKEYATTIEQDKLVASAPPAQPSITHTKPSVRPSPTSNSRGASLGNSSNNAATSAARAVLAARIRVRERQILQRTEYVASSQLTSARRVAAGAPGSPGGSGSRGRR